MRATNLKKLDVSVELVDPSIITYIEDTSKRIQVIPTLVLNRQLNITCGVVCTATEVKYLRVSPEEVQWITTDVGIIYTVTSNIEWKIE
jgi:hypothetical protein